MTANKPVVLLVDTFNGTFEYGKHLCCGRTYLANGMVDEAKVKATEVVASLLPLFKKGNAIIGLEPSCMLTLRDEMMVVGFGTDAQTISEHALLFEEFLACEAAAGNLDALNSKLQATGQVISLHGHWYPKA